MVTFAPCSEIDMLFDELHVPGHGSAPLHCSEPMELVTPALGDEAAGYSFDPAEAPVQLPPVWRCGCGFQLDAWIPPASSGGVDAGMTGAVMHPGQ